MKLLLLVVALATAAAGFKVNPIQYLQQYGYIQPNSIADMSEAITNFQKFAHLPVTGILDDATLKMMEKPRCGVKDIMPASFNKDVRRKKRYVASSRYRHNPDMTYRFLSYSPDLGRNETRRIIRLALDIWTNATNVSFREVTSGYATLMIKFEAGGHGCRYPFDGPGGTLAHAFYPDGTGVHFDEDEWFTDGTKQGRNLLWVATHEFGHSLGLPHSDVYEALMYPWYKGYVADFRLPADDAGAVRALYGCKNMNLSPVSIPQNGAPYDGLLMEKWLNQVGEGIHHIEPDVCVYPHQPNSVSVLKSFEAPVNSTDDFATRIRGYYRAKQSGWHRFFMCADHSAKLYVSSSKNPADKEQLIKVDSPTSKELRNCEQEPTKGHLKAGELYYIEAVHKDSDRDDFLKVGIKPDGGQLEMITSQNAQWALTDTNIRVIVCLGRYETLTCPSNYKLEIVDAAYGLYTSDYKFYDKVKNLCNFDWWSSNYGTNAANCKAKSSKRIVQQNCHGKQQCTLYAHDSVFSDHCGRLVYSVLDVTYRCSSGSVTKPPTQPPSTAGPTTARPTTAKPTTAKPTTAKPTTAKPTTKAQCKDLDTTCPAWAAAGHCRMDHIKYRYCRLSCGVCQGPTKPPTTKAPTTAAPCKDLETLCPSWAAAGHCNLDHIKNRYCRLSCGVCKASTKPPTTAADSCTDRRSDCPELVRRGYSCKNRDSMRNYWCRKTCSTCS